LQNTKTDRFPIKREKKSWNKAIFWTVLGAILIIALYVALSPARVSGSKKYLVSGDNFLANRKFISAIVEYKKAEFLHGGENISDRINIARDGEKDISKLIPFFTEINDIEALNEITEANKVPANVSEGVKAAKAYIENGRPDLGILAATTVTEMDEGYQDAWTYLGLSNYYMMKDAEISSDSREYYKAQAQEAWEKAMSIDPTNETVQGYLETLKKE
jgi:tetratricopeptide (TPR) repeat protein